MDGALETGQNDARRAILSCGIVAGFLTLLDYEEILEGRFSGWRMGRVDLDKVNTAVVLKYSEKPRVDPFGMSGTVALKLLEELASTASIVG